MTENALPEPTLTLGQQATVDRHRWMRRKIRRSTIRTLLLGACYGVFSLTIGLFLLSVVGQLNRMLGEYDTFDFQTFESTTVTTDPTMQTISALQTGYLITLVILLSLVLIVVVCSILQRTSWAAAVLDRVPWLGGVRGRLAAATFADLIAIEIDKGRDHSAALVAIGNSIDHPRWATWANHAAERLRGGESLVLVTEQVPSARPTMMMAAGLASAGSSAESSSDGWWQIGDRLHEQTITENAVIRPLLATFFLLISAVVAIFPLGLSTWLLVDRIRSMTWWWNNSDDSAINRLAWGLAIGTFFLLLVLTCYVIEANYRRHSDSGVARRILVPIRAFYAVLLLIVSVGAIYVVGHPLMLLLVPALWVAGYTIVVANRRFRWTILNDWFRWSLQRGVAIDEILSWLILGSRGTIRSALMSMRNRINSGERASAAAIASRCKFDEQTLAVLDRGPLGETDQSAMQSSSRLSEDQWIEQADGFIRPSVAQTLAYLIGLILFSLLSSLVIQAFGFELLDEMASEFDYVQNDDVDEALQWANRIAYGIVAIIAIWACFALCAWESRFDRLLVWVPWFGNWIRDSRRANWLRSAAGAINNHLSLSELADSERQTTRRRWQRRRSSKLFNALAEGRGDVDALARSHLIRRNERRWLAAAEQNGPARFSAALISLASEIDVRNRNRWQTRLRWLVPIVIVAVGIFVGLHGYKLFDGYRRVIQVSG